MKTYRFYYSTNSDYSASYCVKARNLKQAIKIFYRESDYFPHPVKTLFSRYEVTNSVGKWSSRLISDKYSLVILRGGKIK